MYLQNEKMAELWVFVDFSNKRRLEKIYKTSLQNGTVTGITRRSSCCRRCSVKKLFLKISQNSPENTFAGVFFLVKLQASDLKLY